MKELKVHIEWAIHRAMEQVEEYFMVLVEVKLQVLEEEGCIPILELELVVQEEVNR